MNKTMTKLLAELLKDSKRSDRQLARILGVSQASVSRTRSKLVEDGMIKEFTVRPDLVKMGFEILAISSVKIKMLTKEEVEKGEKWMSKFPNIIFAAAADGMGKNGVMISLHRNYTDYLSFVAENREYWGEDMENYATMLVGLRGIVAKPLSFRYLAKLVEAA